MVYIVMGVSGCGKSTIGESLATAIGLPFYDGDDFHPKANIDKMASGQALDDGDREPWLKELANHIKNWNHKSGAVLACSALKQSYRDILHNKIISSLNFEGQGGSASLRGSSRGQGSPRVRSTKSCPIRA